MPTQVEEFIMGRGKHRLFRQEELMVEVTEAIAEVMHDHEITQKELAARLGKSRSLISQMLGGDRNMTLKTLADVALALGYRVRVNLERIG